MYFKYQQIDGMLFGVGKNMQNELLDPDDKVNLSYSADCGVFLTYEQYREMKNMPANEMIMYIDEMMKYAIEYSNKIEKHNEMKMEEMMKTASEGKERQYKSDGHVYIIKSTIGTKIGISDKHNIGNRVKSYSSLPMSIIETRSYEVHDYTKAERYLHSHYKQKRIKGEWFNLTDEEINEAENILAEKYDAKIHEIKRPVKTP